MYNVLVKINMAGFTIQDKNRVLELVTPPNALGCILHDEVVWFFTTISEPEVLELAGEYGEVELLTQ